MADCQNFRISNFYLEFEEELSFFAYSEILKNQLQGHFPGAMAKEKILGQSAMARMGK